MTLILRRATAEDGPFLGQMLAVAADWRPRSPVRTVSEIIAVPALARYVAGWGRPGDVGFVADDDASIGAAWWRRFDRDDPGYGFVDEAIPEISVGVVDGERRRGVGTRLLAALVAEAERSALPALSLSVEPDNPAARLYERLGFRTVGVNGGSLTMLLDLSKA